jgi:short-subunit dehydrogenase
LKALVTGGSSGLGAAFVDALVARGYDVYATTRDSVKLDSKSGVTYVSLELKDSKRIKEWSDEFIRNYGVPHLLINNAGFGAYYGWDKFPENEISEQLSVMLESPILICRYFVPLMADLPSDNGSPVIINVSSLAGQFPLPFMAIYNAAKAGLSGFSRSLMLEYPDSELRVIDFRPGDFRTRFNEVLSKDFSGDIRLERVWRHLDKHLQDAPDVDVAAKDLMRAIEKKKSGIFYTGDFFQARLGPIFYKMVPDSVIRLFIKLYYKI